MRADSELADKQILMAISAASHRSLAPQSGLMEWVPVIIWGGMIFILSTSTFSAANTGVIVAAIVKWLVPASSPASIRVVHTLVRKTAHFTEYAILFWLLYRGPMRNHPYGALAICIAYACTDEAHQLFVPGRTSSIFDIALDSTGALFSRFLNAAWTEMSS
jgi:VanZ family protein